MDLIRIEGTESQVSGLVANNTYTGLKLAEAGARFDPTVSAWFAYGDATSAAITALTTDGFTVITLLTDAERTAHQTDIDAEIGSGIDTYQTSADNDADLAAIASDTHYSSIASTMIELFNLNHQSTPGPNASTDAYDAAKDIKCIRIGSGSIPVLIIGGVHAREWAPPDSLILFVKKMLNAYVDKTPFVDHGFRVKSPKKDLENDGTYNSKFEYIDFVIPYPEVKAILEKLSIYVVPCVNPNGRDYSLSAGAHRQWRTNRKVLGGNCPDSNPKIGVDVARNFWLFETEDYYDDDTITYIKSVTDHTPCEHLNYYPVTENSETFIGPSALSENEAKNIDELVDEKQIKYFLDVHQYYRGVLVPWYFNQAQVFDNTDASKTFLNTSLNNTGTSGGRNIPGQTPGTYREFFPDDGSLNLQVRHYLLAGQMQGCIFDAAAGDEHARNRSKYRIVDPTQPQYKMYAAPGAPADYVLAKQLEPNGSGGAQVNSRFPIYSLTIEAGHQSDGEFQPAKQTPAKQFRKVQREIFFGLRGFLSFAANWTV